MANPAVITTPLFSHKRTRHTFPYRCTNHFSHPLSFSNPNKFQIWLLIEPVSKRFSLFKVKEGKYFNHMNTLSISRIKFEPGTKIRQTGTFWNWFNRTKKKPGLSAPGIGLRWQRVKNGRNIIRSTQLVNQNLIKSLENILVKKSSWFLTKKLSDYSKYLFDMSPFQNVSVCSSSRAILQDSRIGQQSRYS